MLRLKHLWETLRSSYWFVPALMAVGALLLALGTLSLDRRVDGDFADELRWVFSGGADGGREVLGVIAGSVISTAGIVFSITIAALSLASSQLGPRLLQNFMRDTGNQVVLGTFTSTFLYCLLVLRTIRGEDTGDFVPVISVTVGVLLAVCSVGVLIYFIHHVSVSIQAPIVVAEVGRELVRHVSRTFPEESAGVPERDVPLPEDFLVRAAPVPTDTDGYVQTLDEGGLVELACERNVVVAIARRPGQFVGGGAPLAFVSPPEALDADLGAAIRRSVVIGSRATPEQDVEFAVRQLVEVAVRALSPSVNDPFTATACLDWLGAGLCRAASGHARGPVRADAHGRTRLLFLSPITFAGMADAAFDLIRQNGAGKPAVAIRMLETIEEVARCTAGRRDHLLVLDGHAEQVRRAALAVIEDPRDVRDVEERYDRVRALLAVVPAS
jgi:uncharacterized membrane protein